jgi:Zn-dependent M28 family amino/carboxypeptidase
MRPLLFFAAMALGLGPLVPAAAQAPATPAAAAPAEPQFSPDRIRADVAYLADDALEGRFTVAKGYFTAAGYVAERFQEMGLKPGGTEYKWFQLVPVSLPVGKITRTFKAPNVIGILPGSDPVLKDEYVILSAHLDHIGTDSRPGSDKIYNGAMDNAVGVATMLEAARAFAASGKAPRRSILFVALAAEEEGLIGSAYLAKHPVVDNGRMVADVNLDMPILLYDFQDVVALGAEHSTLGTIVEATAAKMGLTVSPDPMPQENDFVRSDHYSFVQAGIPSVFLETGFKNGGEKAVRSFLSKHYHQVSDEVSLPFDWNAAAKFAKLNYAIARAIADSDEAPRWYAGDSIGNRYATKAPKAPKPAK